jgi:putative tryptophan/tyrosine transport system substrate-binding protein
MSARFLRDRTAALRRNSRVPSPRHAIVTAPQARCGSGIGMKRRHFLALLGSAAVCSVGDAGAQHPERMRRIGVLVGSAQDDPESPPRTTAFEKALADLGWAVGRNIQIDYRSAGGDTAQMQALAKELVELRPDVLLGSTTPVVAALARETQTIPIIFVVVSDPIGSGFIASLPRPGGNITGFINIESSLGAKWIEILKEIAPSLSRVAVMFNPDTAPHADFYVRPFEAAAPSFAVTPVTSQVRSQDDIGRAVSDLSRVPATGLIVLPDTFLAVHRKALIAAAASHKMPTIYPFRFMVSDGGLIAYGVDLIDLFRRAGPYVDRILKGGKPADLPVQQPVKFEFAINLKTATALGLSVPPILLARADEVIQ